jgi:hypothetical protein
MPQKTRENVALKRSKMRIRRRSLQYKGVKGRMKNDDESMKN